MQVHDMGEASAVKSDLTMLPSTSARWYPKVWEALLARKA